MREESRKGRRRELLAIRVRTYRQRHAEELRKARHVLTKLMSLRATRRVMHFTDEDAVESLAGTLLEFLTPQEATALGAALLKRGRKTS